MPIITGYKDGVDLPDWRFLAPAPTASSVGQCIASDLRNSEDRLPFVFFCASATLFYMIGFKADGWMTLASPGLATFNAGMAMQLAPQRGPRGALAGGGSTTSLVLSTALPAVLGSNQLANRGDGIGFKVRVIGLTSGKVEERYCTGNTSSATPTVTLDAPLSFVPQANDLYEFLSGRVYLLQTSTITAKTWQYFDIMTGTWTSASNTNLPSPISTASDSSTVILDELYGPNAPGQGFLLGNGTHGQGSSIVATAASATSISGQVVVGAKPGDTSVLANEYRNFQVRIVYDPVNPTSVNQRRKITSHTAATAGVTAAVYTVPTWTVTPSSSAEFVIENCNEILLWTSNSPTTFTYAQDAVGAASADTWSTATYGTKTASVGPYMAFQPFAMTLDAGKNARYSQVFVWRGATTTTLDVLDIAGGATGLWSNGVPYGAGPIFLAGSCLTYDPSSKYAYIAGANGTNLASFRFDAVNRVIEPWAGLRFTAGSAVLGQRLATTLLFDSTGQKIPAVMQLRGNNVETFQSFITRP